MPDIDRKTISATEAPALLDASPYTTRWMLYRRFAHGDPIETAESNRMDWGKKMEPLCLDQAANDLHFEVIPNKEYTRRGLLGCTRDAQIINPDRGPGALETKVVFDYGVWMREWDGGKRPPRHIEIQNQVQQYVGDGVTPFRWGVISAWCGGEQFYFEREPIPELWKLLDEKAGEFFADVETKREPNPFGDPLEVPLLTKLYPLVAKKVLDLSALTSINAMSGDGAIVVPEEDKRRTAAMEDARLLKWHSTERLGHERSEKALKAKFLALGLDVETILLPGGVKVNLKQQSRKGYAVEPTTFKTVDVYVPEEK